MPRSSWHRCRSRAAWCRGYAAGIAFHASTPVREAGGLGRDTEVELSDTSEPRWRRCKGRAGHLAVSDWISVIVGFLSSVIPSKLNKNITAMSNLRILYLLAAPAHVHRFTYATAGMFQGGVRTIVRRERSRMGRRGPGDRANPEQLFPDDTRM